MGGNCHSNFVSTKDFEIPRSVLFTLFSTLVHFEIVLLTIETANNLTKFYLFTSPLA